MSLTSSASCWKKCICWSPNHRENNQRRVSDRLCSSFSSRSLGFCSVLLSDGSIVQIDTTLDFPVSTAFVVRCSSTCVQKPICLLSREYACFQGLMRVHEDTMHLHWCLHFGHTVCASRIPCLSWKSLLGRFWSDQSQVHGTVWHSHPEMLKLWVWPLKVALKSGLSSEMAILNARARRNRR